MNFQKFRRCCNNYIYTYAVSTEFTGVGVHRGVDREEVVAVGHTAHLLTIGCSQYGENKMNTNIKIWEFCFQDFSDGVTVESHAHGPCGSAIEDHLAVRNISPPKLPSFRLIE